MSLQPVQALCTVEDYLALERASEERHEYLDGQVYAMAGESPEHGTICTNLTILIASQLRGTPCQAWAKDTKVRSGPTPHPRQPARGMFSYPDVVVVCGEPRFHDQYRDVLLNPVVLIEVVSPTTEAFDRGDKFFRYRTWLPSLTDYILVAQAAHSWTTFIANRMAPGSYPPPVAWLAVSLLIQSPVPCAWQTSMSALRFHRRYSRHTPRSPHRSKKAAL